MLYTGSHGLFASVGVATSNRVLTEGSIQVQIRVVAQKLTLSTVQSIAGWFVTPVYGQVDKWTPCKGFDVSIDQALTQIVLFMGGIFAAFGIWAFYRSELATAQGNQ